MKHFVSIVVMIVAFTSSAHASEPRFTAYSKILTYEQLMRLSVTQRLEYLEGVRSMMSELEAMSYETAKSDPEHARRLNAYLRLLQATIATADATVTGIPVLQGRSMGCEGSSIIASQIPGTNEWVCRKLAVNYESCPQGYVAARQSPTSGRFYCYTRQSFLRLRAATQRQQRTPASGNIPARLRQAFASSGVAPARVASRAVTFRQPTPHQPAAASAARVPAPVRARPVASRTEARVERNQSRRTVRESTTAASAALSRATTDDFEAFAIDACPEAAEPEGLTCSRETVNAAKERLYARQGGTPACIYAGHVRNYRNGRVQPRNCEPITEFCSESDNCRDVLTDQKQSPRFKCGGEGRVADAGKILCNPLIFGFRRSDASPYCVSSGSNATRACQQLSDTEMDGDQLARFEWVSGGGNSGPAMDSQTMDKIGVSVATSEKLQGFKELWDNFARSINTMCVDDRDLRQAFCQECEIIRKRAVAMNMQATAAATTVKVCTKLLEFRNNQNLTFGGQQHESPSTPAGTITGSVATSTIASPQPPSLTLTAAPGAQRDPALDIGPTAEVASTTTNGGGTGSR